MFFHEAPMQPKEALEFVRFVEETCGSKGVTYTYFVKGAMIVLPGPVCTNTELIGICNI
jgi:hypothetical protein